ncbi:MAG TPA: SDR family oxidoreductase [Fibrobacteria bacterium]|jgi:NAD(P)-dependent dehydrogenase (short-subunit alcohol dehydrogenase family)|nr:SDR family oxidoreductase [Fibrobacteria bacterium]
MTSNEKNVLLTGASSGIGLAAARLLASQGYRVVGTCRDPASAPEIPGVEFIAMDNADALSVERGFAEARRRLGRIDILVNNAGSGELGAVEDTPDAEVRRLFEVNYFSAVTLTRLCLPEMRARGAGTVVQMGSIVFSLQFPFKAQYCAAKSALSAFTLSLRHEVKPYGIRVHLLEPGWVRSAFHTRLKPIAPEGSPYAARLAPFLDYSRDHDPRVIDGEGVARVLLATLENPGAPVRIAVGADAKRFFRVSRFLSHAMLDRILGRKLARKAAR